MSHPRSTAGVGGFGPAHRASLATLIRRRLPDDAAARRFCIATGVGMRTIGRAMARHPLQADRHLELCAALGCHPVSLTPLDRMARPPRRIAGPIAWWHLGVGLALTREIERLSVRAAAERVALSPASFVRAEKGARLSVDAFFRLASGFLGLHPHDVTAPAAARPDLVAARTLAGATGVDVSRGTVSETR